MQTVAPAIWPAPSIELTPAHSEGKEPVAILSTRLLTYVEEQGFTRLRLTGGQTLDVRETTGEIDHLLRAAASNAR